MDIFELQITEEQNGTRLDSFLAKELEGISRSYLQKLIGEQQITVNQKAVKLLSPVHSPFVRIQLSQCIVLYDFIIAAGDKIRLLII